jgi:hypothetical protein
MMPNVQIVGCDCDVCQTHPAMPLYDNSSSSSSSSIRDDGRLDYGLPARALDVLYQQYQSSNNIIIDEQHSLKKTSTARNLIIGVFSGVCI